MLQGRATSTIADFVVLVTTLSEQCTVPRLDLSLWPQVPTVDICEQPQQVICEVKTQQQKQHEQVKLTASALRSALEWLDTFSEGFQKLLGHVVVQRLQSFHTGLHDSKHMTAAPHVAFQAIRLTAHACKIFCVCCLLQTFVEVSIALLCRRLSTRVHAKRLLRWQTL